MDRRKFLQAGAAGLALSTLGGYARGFAETQPKRVGLIGTGWYGKSALFRLLQIAPVEVVALCDVDKNMLAEAAEMVAARQVSKKTPHTFADYRDMLKQEQFDIVHIATPDHWHALPMIAACQAGADIYVEKPISADILEGQSMLAAARKHNRMVQVNLERRSTPHLAEAKETIIQEGKLGKIGLVEICCYYHMRAGGNPPDANPPENLDYEMWTGPAPMQPFNPMMHPRGWRAFMEYGNGIVGDMCVHMYDMVRWMMGLGWPKSISSTGGIYLNKGSRSNISDTQTITFAFDDLNVVWTHRTWGKSADPDYPWGATFYGDKGTLKAGVMGYDFIPERGGDPIHKDVLYELDQYPEDKTEKDLERHVAPALRRHWKNLLECIETRSQPVSNIEEGYISTASCILGNLSMKLGRSLTWDAANGRIAGDDEANKLLARPYRQPWIHPDPQNV